MSISYLHGIKPVAKEQITKSNIQTHQKKKTRSPERCCVEEPVIVKSQSEFQGVLFTTLDKVS